MTLPPSKLPWDLQQLVEALIKTAMDSKKWRVAMVVYEKDKDENGQYEMVPAFSYGPRDDVGMPTLMMFPALEFLRIAMILREIGVKQASGEGVEVRDMRNVPPPARN